MRISIHAHTYMHMSLRLINLCYVHNAYDVDVHAYDVDNDAMMNVTKTFTMPFTGNIVKSFQSSHAYVVTHCMQSLKLNRITVDDARVYINDMNNIIFVNYDTDLTHACANDEIICMQTDANTYVVRDTQFTHLGTIPAYNVTRSVLFPTNIMCQIRYDYSRQIIYDSYDMHALQYQQRRLISVIPREEWSFNHTPIHQTQLYRFGANDCIAIDFRDEHSRQLTQTQFSDSRRITSGIINDNAIKLHYDLPDGGYSNIAIYDLRADAYIDDMNAQTFTNINQISYRTIASAFM